RRTRSRAPNSSLESLYPRCTMRTPSGGRAETAPTARPASRARGKDRAARARIVLIPRQEDTMNLILLIVLIMLLVGALPTWPYSQGWGYYPSGGLGLVLLLLVIMALMRPA